MKNQSNVDTYLCEIQKKYQFIMMGCVAAVFIICGLIGNTLTFIVFIRGRQKHTILVWLRTLAVADSLYLLGYATTQCWYQFFSIRGK